MKIYEKPMAIIEKIDVEDVITTSEGQNPTAAELGALKASGAVDNETVILFQW